MFIHKGFSNVFLLLSQFIVGNSGIDLHQKDQQRSIGLLKHRYNGLTFDVKGSDKRINQYIKGYVVLNEKDGTQKTDAAHESSFPYLRRGGRDCSNYKCQCNIASKSRSVPKIEDERNLVMDLGSLRTVDITRQILSFPLLVEDGEITAQRQLSTSGRKFSLTMIIEIRFNQRYDEDLDNFNSVSYRNFTKNVTERIETSFPTSKSMELLKVQVLSIRRGSVITTVALEISSDRPMNNQTSVASLTKNAFSGSASVTILNVNNISSVQGTSTSKPTTDVKLEEYQIALMAILIIVFIFAIIVVLTLIIIWRRSQDRIFNSYMLREESTESVPQDTSIKPILLQVWKEPIQRKETQLSFSTIIPP